MEVTLRLEDFLERVLPNLGKIPYIVRHTKDEYELLTSLHGTKEQILNLLHKKHKIKVCDQPWSFDEEHKLDTAEAFIINQETRHMNGHFVTLVIYRKKKIILFLDSKDTGSGIRYYKDLQETLDDKYQDYELIDIPCPKQSMNNSICHAYLNAKLILYGIDKFGETREKLMTFINDFQHNPIVSTDNADKMTVYYFQTDFLTDSQEDLDEEKLCLQRKEKVDKFIVFSVSVCRKLLDIKEHVANNILHNDLDRREEAYIQNMYVKCCKTEFLAELEESVIEEVNQDVESILRTISYLKKIEHFIEIGSIITKLKYYSMITDCITSEFLNRSEEKHLIFMVRKTCLSCVQNKIKSFKFEKDFVRELLKYFNDCFYKNVDLFQNRVYIIPHKQTLLSEILTYLRDSTEVSDNLKKLSVKVNEKSLRLGDAVHRLVTEFFQLPTVKPIVHKNKKVIRCEGAYLRFELVVKEVSNIEFESFEEVQIFANRMLLVNKSMVWPGKNVAIFAGEMYVSGHILWDLSGKNGTKEFAEEKAKGGTNDGDDGTAGMHGNHGESGGNVYIETTNIHSSANLTILSNGGDGANGQHGGDGSRGQDGTDGFGLTEDKFKMRFPPTAFYFAFKHDSPMSTNIEQINIIENTHYSSDSAYITGKIKEGNRVIFSYYNDHWIGFPLHLFGHPARQTYCFIEGRNGTPGQKGGDGGKGGDPGQGGHRGRINIEPQNNINITAHTGNTGKQGENGKGGEGGKNGKRGLDNARMEMSHYKDASYMHGNLKLRYDGIKSNGVWCPKHKKYARIEKVENPRCVQQASGTDGRNQKRSSTKEQGKCFEKPSILAEDLHQEYINRLNSECYEDQEWLENAVKSNTDTLSKSSLEAKKNTMYSLPIGTEKCEDENDSEIDVLMAHFLRKETRCAETSALPHKGVKTKNEELNKLICSLTQADNITDWIKITERTLVTLEENRVDEPTVIEEIFDIVDDNIKRFVLNKDNINTLIVLLNQNKFNESKNCMEKILKYLHTKYKFVLLQTLFAKIEDKANIWFENKSKCSNISCVEVIFKRNFVNFCCNIVKEILDVNEKIDDLDNFITSKENQAENQVEQLDDWMDNEDQRDKISLISFGFGDEEQEQAQATQRNASVNDEATVKDVKETTVPGKKEVNTEAQRNLREEINDIASGLDKDTSQLIKKLVYLKQDAVNLKLLAKVLSQRIKYEGLQISFDMFKWLIVSLLNNSKYTGIESFLLLFSSNEQEAWLAEYLQTQLSEHIGMSYQEEIEFKKTLSQFKDHSILLLLSQQLTSTNPEENLTTQDIISILELSHDIDIDESVINYLQNRSIADWPYTLRWLKILLDFQKLPADGEWTEDAIAEAAFCMAEISNQYSYDISNSLMQSFNKQQGISIELLLTSLQNFRRNLWHLDERAFGILNKEPYHTWTEKMTDLHLLNEERNLSKLLELIEKDKKNSITTQTLMEVKDILECINKRKCSKSLIANPDKEINLFTKEDITKWTSNFNDQVGRKNKEGRLEDVKKYLPEIIAVIDQAIYIINKFYLRDTQKLSVVLFLHGDKHGLLQQISTGEGKSLIISSLAIVKALSGYNVDIITSSSLLAQRDAKAHNQLYSLFGISANDNCSEIVMERKKIYSENSSVVYGEIGAFQRDLLLNSFYDEDVGIGNREQSYVIVDEVDSMLLDKGQNVLYISHNIPGMDALEPVYVYIWTFVHNKGMVGTKEDIRKVEEAMMNAMYGTLSRPDLGEVMPEDQVDSVWNQLVENKIIEKHGRILLKEEELEEMTDISHIDKVSLEIRQAIVCGLKNAKKQGELFLLPKYLSSFIELHLQRWIESAFQARYMNQNDQYIIDVDRSDARKDVTANIIIMDKDTGVEQYHSQWNNGLHQFLQLKHGCRISFESLKAVFMSNVSFFSAYKKVYGLTGTLGSVRERDLLKSLYSVDYVTIPTFRPSRFIEHMSRVCSSENEWIAEIQSTAKKVLAQNRPVLVICDCVKNVEKIEKSFDNRKELYVYKRSYEPLTIGSEEPIGHGCIILATNLAGRGTDIKISDEISEKGGMHICLTYIASNQRVEEQAFGRAARKGQKGSGQIICLTEDNIHHKSQSEKIETIVKLKVKRHFKEHQRIDEIKKYYQSHIQTEEKFFEQFKTVYQLLQKKLLKSGNDRSSIILQSCLDEWAFWLDRACQSDTTLKNADISNFLTSITKISGDNKHYPDLLKSPAQKIKLALDQAKRKCYDESLELLEQMIRDDEDFSEVAHYYAAYCLGKSDSTKQQSRVQSITEHLRKASDLLRKRCNALALNPHILAPIRESYRAKRECFLYDYEYSTQKEDMINIYSIFTKSIDEIIGIKVNVDMLESESVDPIQAREMFDNLVYNNILTRSCMCKAVTDMAKDKWKNLRLMYELHFKELKNVLVELGGNVTAKTFRNVLPSREEFWDELIDSGMLKDQVDYIILDKEKLEESFKSENIVFSSIKKRLINIKGCNDFHNMADYSSEHGDSIADQTSKRVIEGQSKFRQICLFPEQLDDIESGKLTAIKQSAFLESFGNLKIWKALRQKKILMINKIGTLEIINSRKLKKYDGLDRDVFTEIRGVNQSKSREIFKVLKCTNAVYSESQIEDLIREAFNLKDYRYIQTEIINVIRKHFMYRLVLIELWQSGDMVLSSKPHKLLFNDLVSMNIIKPVMVNSDLKYDDIRKKLEIMYGQEKTEDYGRINKKQLSNSCWIDDNVSTDDLWQTLEDINWIEPISKEQAYITCTEESVRDGHLKMEKFKSILPALNNLLGCIISQKRNVEMLSEVLESWKGVLSNYDSIEFNLISIDNHMNTNPNYQLIGLIKNFVNNGFSNVITTVKRKWTSALFETSKGRAFLGVCQITVGAIVSTYSAGMGMMIGKSLMKEGVSDIISAFTEDCTWNDYLRKKAVSVTLSGITSGIGTVISRGAKASKDGFKYGKTVYKVICKKIAKKVGEAGAQGISNMLAIRDIKRDIEGRNISKPLSELYTKVGKERAEQIISKIMKECRESEWHGLNKKVLQNLVKVTDAICGGFNMALDDIQRHGSSSNIQFISNCIKSYGKVKEVGSMLNLFASVKKSVDTYIKTFELKLNEVVSSLSEEDSHQVPNNDNSEEEFKEFVIQQLQTDITDKVSEAITNTVVKPVIQYGAKQIVNHSTKMFKKAYKKYKNIYHQNKNNSSRTQVELKGDNKTCKKVDINKVYQDQLNGLLQATKDSHLLADIIREDIPVNVLWAPAIAELVDTRIILKTISDDGSESVRDFCPTGESQGDPIVLKYHEKQEECGYFSVETGCPQDAPTVKNECLLMAIFSQTNIKITKKELADKIETDLSIRSNISIIFHHQFAENDTTGGMQSLELKDKKGYIKTITSRKMVKMKETMKLSAKTLTVETNNERKSRQEIDISINRQINTWVERPIKQGRSSINNMSFDHVDVLFSIKFDARYVIWKYQDGTLQGQSGSLYHDSNKTTPRTEGLASFHAKRYCAVMQTNTALEATITGLKCHTENLVSVEELRNMEIHYDCYTSTGHNLKIKEERLQFCIGYEREMKKMALVIKALENKGKFEEKWFSTEIFARDQYIKRLRTNLIKSNSIYDIGMLLQNPAPYD